MAVVTTNNNVALLVVLFALVSSTTLAASQPIPNPPSSHSHFLPPLSTLKAGHALIQLGGFWSSQGASQHININGLIGDTFSVTKHDDGNALVGLGYFIEGQARGPLAMSYGVNGFYLARTSVSGTVTQENLFTNLSYGYHLTHYPVYAMAASTIPLKSTKQSLTLDVGIGPNFMPAGGFQESSLDNGVSLPDNAFSGHTTTTFSATVGLGIRINNVFGKVPLECGYRFFYLGQGHFNTETNQLQNTLNTGNTYANALLCGIRI
jgi:hypothetical protein